MDVPVRSFTAQEHVTCFALVIRGGLESRERENEVRRGEGGGAAGRRQGGSESGLTLCDHLLFPLRAPCSLPRSTRRFGLDVADVSESPVMVMVAQRSPSLVDPQSCSILVNDALITDGSQHEQRQGHQLTFAAAPPARVLPAVPSQQMPARICPQNSHQLRSARVSHDLNHEPAVVPGAEEPFWASFVAENFRLVAILLRDFCAHRFDLLGCCLRYWFLLCWLLLQGKTVIPVHPSLPCPPKPDSLASLSLTYLQAICTHWIPGACEAFHLGR